MLWVAEEVSIHKEGELKAQDQDSLIVGHTMSCRFGKIYYEGTIIGVGSFFYFVLHYVCCSLQ